MNAIDRNLVLGDEVTDNSVSHMLRTLNASLAARPRVPFHLYDVALLPLQLGCDLVESFLCFGVQSSLAGAETNFGIADFLILVEPCNGRIQLASLIAGVLRE